jgi:hypothetical protein
VATLPVILLFTTASESSILVLNLSPLIQTNPACGIGQLTEFIRSGLLHNIHTKGLERWSESLYTASIATNVIGTGLIAFRIWYFHWHNVFASLFLIYTTRSILRLGVLGKGTYKRVLTLVIESGMMYSIFLTLEILLYLVGNNGFYVVYESLAQISVRSAAYLH